MYGIELFFPFSAKINTFYFLSWKNQPVAVSSQNMDKKRVGVCRLQWDKRLETGMKILRNL